MMANSSQTLHLFSHLFTHLYFT